MPPETAKLMPLDRLDPEKIAALQGIFFDIDDTFTCHGRIPACAFDALWALHNAGLMTIPVTGRPASWCDHIARMWPVDAVIGENGALYFWMDPVAGKLKKVFADSEACRREKKQRLKDLGRAILLNGGRHGPGQ